MSEREIVLICKSELWRNTCKVFWTRGGEEVYMVYLTAKDELEAAQRFLTMGESKLRAGESVVEDTVDTVEKLLAHREDRAVARKIPDGMTSREFAERGFLWA